MTEVEVRPDPMLQLGVRPCRFQSLPMLQKVIDACERHFQSDSVVGLLFTICQSSVRSEGALQSLLERAFSAYQRNDHTFRVLPRRERTEGRRRYDFLLQLPAEKVVLEVKHVRSNDLQQRQATDLVRQLKDTQKSASLGAVFITASCAGRQNGEALRTNVENAAKTFVGWLTRQGIVQVGQFDANVSQGEHYGMVRAIFIGGTEMLWRLRPGFYRVYLDFGIAGSAAELAERFAAVAELVCTQETTAVFHTEDLRSFVDAILSEDKFADIECLTEDERLVEDLQRCMGEIFQRKRWE